ncbi:Pentatricopeptide repeat-containing protein [Forsythia ovata]|uniref:Pentatricopeptide repeat-containing protein n=1 Tax=Forsythia ovata TaxID=205694 RepID=A0ABD1UBW0_9LAMI
MHRLLWSVRLKSIANSFWELKTPEYALKSAAGIVQGFRYFGTSNGGFDDIECWRKEPMTRTMQEEIVDALRLGERNRASNLLSELVRRNHALRAGDFVYILQYCSRAPDPLFVLETWKFMEENGIDISCKCYFLTVRALCKGGYLKEALNFVNILGENSDATPTLPVYNNLLGACVQMHSLNYANECLNLMEHQMMGRNEITYSELLKLAVLQQDLSAVHKIWKECIKCYTLSIITLRKFVWSFTKLGDLESAYATLQQMVAMAFQGNLNISRTAEGKLYNLRLDVPIPCRAELTWKRYNKMYDISSSSDSEYHKEEDLTKSEQRFELGMKTEEVRSSGVSFPQRPLSVPVMKVLRWSFSDVIHTCAGMRNAMLAEQLMSQMQNLGLEPSCSTYDGFIRAVVSVRGFHEGMEVLRVMQHKSMKPCNSTLAAISVSCSRALELDLAEALLNQISESPHAHPYNSFLEACDTLDQPERAVSVLAKMKQLNLQPDIRTYELLFSLFGNVNAPYEDGNILSQVDAAKRINAIEMDMMKHGFQHSHRSMNNLLKALGAEGMIKELIQYLHFAENQFSHSKTFPGTPIYNTVLHSLVEAKESHMAIEIFKSMMSCGFPPDAVTYNIMIDCCSIIKCFRSANALVSMMIRSGFNPHAVTYTSLIKILLEFENFDEALELLDQGSSEGILPDLLLYNTILQVASEKGRIDVIELMIEQMHQEKIQPDASTISCVFSAYVDNGFHSTAMEALQVLSMRMISEENILQEDRIEYENLIFAEDKEAELQILEAFKDSKESLTAALLYLRWCALGGCPISWLPNQSQWAKRLSSNYASKKMSHLINSRMD